jgi:ribosome-associated protein
MPGTTATTRTKKTTSAKTTKTRAAAKRPLLTGTVRAKSRPAKKAASSKRPAKTAAKKTTVKKIAAWKPAPAKPSPKATAIPLPVLSAAEYPQIVQQCLSALDEKKAGELQVLDVRGKSSVTDFFIIATATSEPHLRALRVALEKELAGTNTRILGRESSTESGWCVVDAFDVIIHLFLAAKRTDYDIEGLWSGSPRRRPVV